jgi:hypothetical protein
MRSAVLPRLLPAILIGALGATIPATVATAAAANVTDLVE